jgi:hypothetical protein
LMMFQLLPLRNHLGSSPRKSYLGLQRSFATLLSALSRAAPLDGFDEVDSRPSAGGRYEYSVVPH